MQTVETGRWFTVSCLLDSRTDLRILAARNHVRSACGRLAPISTPFSCQVECKIKQTEEPNVAGRTRSCNFGSKRLLSREGRNYRSTYESSVRVVCNRAIAAEVVLLATFHRSGAHC